MTDLEIAIANLKGHSICLCKKGEYFTDDGRGISPMMRFIAEGKELTGFCVADQIVGKAAAMLFVKAGVRGVYGKTMSHSGKAFLEANNIPHSYDILTDRIINRQGTDICPMEKAVADINDADEGYQNLVLTLNKLRSDQ